MTDTEKVKVILHSTDGRIRDEPILSSMVQSYRNRPTGAPFPSAIVIFRRYE